MPDMPVVGRRELITRAAVVAGGITLAGENDHTLGIENEGAYITGPPRRSRTRSPRPWRGCATCTASTRTRRSSDTVTSARATLYARLPQLRDDVASRLGLLTSTAHTAPFARTALPGPRALGDHGPAVGAGEPRP